MAQQKELSEIKDLVKTLISQQQHTPITSPSSGAAKVNSPSSHESESIEDIKVHMQLLQKSAASQFSKASKEFSKQCSILFKFFCVNCRQLFEMSIKKVPNLKF